MTFWKCYYHLICATHQRQPLITPEVKKVIYIAIEERARGMKCHILAMNAMPDHLHIAMNIPPSYSIADCMQNLKGLSAYRVNQISPDTETIFRWQKGYGVLTFGAKNLSYVQSYIENQQIHHTNDTTENYLERLS
ncbi:MAG: IS200/IS605 family transposase [Aggregatilineales bacterium]